MSTTPGSSAAVARQLRLHATTLYASLFRYDDEILVNPHVYGEAASANPTLHLRRLAGGTVADHHLTCFERVWATATPWVGGGTECEWRGMGSRVEFWNDAHAPPANSLVPACGVLATDEQGRVLLQRRRDTGQWALPMGKMELGETPSQCAVRETREETGIVVTVTGLLGVFSDPGHIVAYGDGEIRQEYEVILLARPLTGKPLANEEASDVAWVPPGDLQGLDIHPTQWRQLNHYLSGTYPHVD